MNTINNLILGRINSSVANLCGLRIVNVDYFYKCKLHLKVLFVSNKLKDNNGESYSGIPQNGWFQQLFCFYKFFLPPSYYVWETLVIMQVFDFQFLADLHVLGSAESKKNPHKISMVSGCSLVSMLVCQYFSMLVCQLVSLLVCVDDVF